MKINYNKTGAERKSLVAAISQELNLPTKYLAAPSFAYEVGGYRIDKNGTLEGADNLNLVADIEGLHSFVAISAEYDTPTTYEEALGGLGALETFKCEGLTEGEELGLGSERREHDAEPPAYGTPKPANSLTVEMPLVGFSETALDNLTKLVKAKSSLLKAALGVEALLIEKTEDTIRFPWFSGVLDGDAVKAYTILIERICEAAKQQKRVTSKERGIPENAKYAMRVWLLKLGFIGVDTKDARRILLANLEGNSSFHTPRAAATATETE